MDYIVCHYGEIGLKGGNRKFFEEQLVRNIKQGLPPVFFEFVKRIFGRILIKLTAKGAKNQQIIKERLQNVFGIVNFAFAENCEQKIETMEKKAYEILKNRKFKSFRIASRRSGKDFPLTSQKINERVGAFIVKKLKKDVDLENPDITCFIEITDKYAFLYSEKVRGRGGLPLGVSGKAVVLLSGGIDSPVAGFLTMKRGVRAIFLHFHAYPYTSRASIEKVRKIIKVLNKFQFQSKLYSIPFGDIQKEILLKTPKKLRVILYRRFMMRIAEVVAQKEKALAIVTGESIGQVASQTLENIKVIEEVVGLPVFRPLISQDKEETIKKAEEIGTFDISILPEQDCCARFLPRHPETKARSKEVEAAEKKLNIQKLIKEALQKGAVEKVL